jgi:hypothetical protein
VTLIINGKATTLTAEQVIERLKQMPAEMLAKAELMPSAPPKYHVRGMAINIITKDFAGTNQFSGQLNAGIKQHKYTSGSAGGSFIYNPLMLSGKRLAMCTTAEAMDALNQDPRLPRRLGQITRVAAGTTECFNSLFRGECDVVLADTMAIYYFNCH